MALDAQCYDTQSCIRCFACMVACGTENDARQQRDSGIPMERNVQQAVAHRFHLAPRVQEVGHYPDARRFTGFRHCRHCENAPCKKICPTKAIGSRPGGAVVIREELCIGCQSCAAACPFDVPQYSKERNKATKCTLCYDRTEAGLKPACVSACPTGALFSGSPDDVAKEAQARAERYTKMLGMPYVVYGDSAVNSYVGKLRWMTIAPVRDAAFYQLPSDPTRPGNALRKVATVGDAVGPAGLAVGLGVHMMGWLARRKDQLASHDVNVNEREG